MSKVFILDPALKDLRGHHFRLTNNISKNCTAAGLRTHWLVNNSFKSIDGFDSSAQVRNSFGADTYNGHKPAAQPSQNPSVLETMAFKPRKLTLKSTVLSAYRRLPVKVRHHLTPALKGMLAKSSVPGGHRSNNGIVKPEKLRPEQEIYRALKHFDYSGTDIALFHTSDAHTYRDVVNFFEKLAHVSEWNKFPVFHLSTPYDEKIMPHNNKSPDFRISVRRLRNLGLLNSRVFLHAENDLLAKHLTRVLECDVDTLHIPPLSVPLVSETIARSTSLNVMYLGAARTEKGFNYLPVTVSDVLDQQPQLDVQFYIQITPQIMGYTPDILQSVEELRKISSERLTLIEEPLAEDDYNRMLQLADVLVLNYEPDRYEVRSSGIAIESILSETTLISSRGTFPAYIAGDAGVSIEHGNNVYAAIQKIYGQREKFKTLARERRCRYLSEHSEQRFIELICQPGSQVEDIIIPGQVRYADNTVWKSLL